MKIYKIILFSGIILMLLNCVSTDTQQTGYSPELLLDVDLIVEEQTSIQVEKPLTIILTSDFSENYSYHPDSSMEINGVISYTDIEILNFRTSILNSLEKRLANTFNISFSEEKSQKGLELVINTLTFDGSILSATVELFYMSISYLNLTIYADTANYNDLPKLDYYTLNSWRDSIKAQEKYKIEFSIKNLVNKLHEHLLNNDELNQMSFWDFPMLDSDQEIGGILLPANSLVKEYYNSGNIKTVVLPEYGVFEIDGIKYVSNTWDRSVEFYETGIPTACELALDSLINGMLFKAETYLTFHESGAVKSGTLAAEIEIEGIKFQASYLYLYENGDLEAGVLAYDTLIQGKQFEVGDMIMFDNDGDVSYAK